jgi:hypothetical protein
MEGTLALLNGHLHLDWILCHLQHLDMEGALQLQSKIITQFKSIVNK